MKDFEDENNDNDSRKVEKISTFLRFSSKKSLKSDTSCVQTHI